MYCSSQTHHACGHYRAKEWRTTHEAQDVIEGTKYAANVWIHMYDSVEPTKKGCS
jgi:hypothetical protein